MTDRSALERALAEHDEAVARILPTGDAQAIKKLYVELGASLDEAIRELDAPALSYPETAPAVVNLLQGTNGPVLDAGCGPNPVPTLELGASGRLIVGVDIGLGMVALARRSAMRAGVDFLGVVADLEQLPFADGTFPAVVCDDTIEHVPDDGAGAAEVVRVTADGGRAVIATPNRHRLDVLARRARDLLQGRRQPSSHYFAVASHLREYTWRQLEGLVSPWGSVSARGHVPWSRADVVGRIANRITRWPLFRRVGRVVLIAVTPRTRSSKNG